MTSKDYGERFNEQMAGVFATNPEFFDHRKAFPWLRGYLGAPCSGVFFVGENPSLRQVERARNPDGAVPTPEAQWFASKGDKLFRTMLVKHGFKDGGVSSLGGWRCYVTNTVKEADYAKNHGAKHASERNRLARAWAPVLNWELERCQPRLVVLMGKEVARLMRRLSKEEIVRLPVTEEVPHYSGVAMRPKGRLGPMHPKRLACYNAHFERIARRLNELS